MSFEDDKDKTGMRSLEELQTSEIRYRRLFESARDGILIFDFETGKVTDANPFMSEFLGYAREEFLGRELWEFGLPGDKEVNIKVFKELQRTGYIRHDNLPLKTISGEPREVECVGNVYEENNRRVIQHNIRDNSEKKRLKLGLQRSQIHLANAQRVAHIGSWDFDVENNKIFLSDEIYRIFELPLGSLEKSAELILNYIHPEDLPMVQSLILDTSFSQGIPYNFENRIVRPSGEERIVHSIGEIAVDKSGKPIWMNGTAQDITERKKAEEGRWQAETNYRNLVESSPGIVYLNKPDSPFASVYITPNIQTYGYSPEEWCAEPNIWRNIIHSEDRERVNREYESAARLSSETDIEYRIVSRDGATHWWQDKRRFVADEKGNRTGWQGLILNITKTKGLEEQLRQAHKLESVGLLAGGIAHDFNNMLTAINGYSDLILRRLNPDDPLRQNIEEIRKAGQRSAELTHQLLAFSRRQVLQPITLDLNEAIGNIGKMLQRLIGEDVQLTTTFNPKLGRVRFDPGQFSQIIMNLAINARDAMPQGGHLTIETANIFLDPSYTRQHVGLLPGAYVMLAVSDTGTGMSDEVKQHMFEPFFTTKEIGQGTGLGLATVYGIVRQSEGNIEVYSEEGIGTTFKIYLPRIIEQGVSEDAETPLSEMPEGTEAILLVEDEEIVRNLTRQILEDCGYTVTVATNGAEALALCEKEDCSFDLLITDVVMPEMGGRELAEELAPRVPGLRILFTSGYTNDAIVRHGVIATNTNFIQKPFSPEELAAKIRKILDNPDKS